MLPSDWNDQLVWLTERILAALLGPTGVRSVIAVAVILAVALALEAASGKNIRSRYFSPNFRIDVLYYVFYYSGLYQFLVLAWVYGAIMHLIVAYAPWLQLKLASDLPAVAQYAILYIVVDFIHYWNHRWRHASRFLWAFHSVHHATAKLTVMTNYRFHIFDETFVRICMFIPFQILLGAPVEVWLWLDLFMVWVTLLQHSELNWSYGRAGRLFVSPVFHRLHHSTNEEHQGCNFGGTFSFWDDLFGTANRTRPPALSYGLAGHPVRESLLGQFIYPFIKIRREFGQAARTAAPADASAGRE